jgi:hypothetical protein
MSAMRPCFDRCENSFFMPNNHKWQKKPPKTNNKSGNVDTLPLPDMGIKYFIFCPVFRQKP